MSISDDISDLRSIKENSFNSLLDSVNPRAAFDFLINMLSPMLCDKNIQLSFNDEHDLPASLKGDFTRLHQVLVNILKFVHKSAQNYSEIEITSFCDQENQLLHVRVVNLGIYLTNSEESQLLVSLLPSNINEGLLISQSIL